MKHWHFDDESEEIVDDGVEELVSHLPPWHMSDGLELVVDEELRAHHDEPEHVDTAREGREDPRVPAPVPLVLERVQRRARHQQEQHVRQVLHRHVVVLFCLVPAVRLPVPESQHRDPPTSVHLHQSNTH